MKTNWTIKGKLVLEPDFSELKTAPFSSSATSPLKGVRVKISAREKVLGVWGPWNSWGEVTTDTADGGTLDAGEFSLTKEKDKSDRRFKVEVLFKDDDLKIYPDNNGLISQFIEKLTDSTIVIDLIEDALEQAVSQLTRVAYDVDWFTVHEDDADHARDSGTVNLSTLTFGPSRSFDRGGKVARRHAQIWLLYKVVIGLLESFGSGLGFPEKTIAIKYPHNNPLIKDTIEAAYANPENYVIYIVENSDTDWYSISTLLHELMHIWAYQHSTREKGIAWQLIIHGSTHDGRQNKAWVPFHEAFAEWAHHQLYRTLFGKNSAIYRGTEAQPLPFSRSFLRSEGINTLADVDHFEMGWLSLFNLLIAQDLHKYDFNSSGTYVTPKFSPGAGETCASPRLTFRDVLTVFNPNSAAGFKDSINRNEMTARAFLNRAAAILPGIDAQTVNLYLELLNPNSTVQPKDRLCRKK